MTTPPPAPRPIPGARVLLFDAGFSAFYELRTNPDGLYRFDVPPGTYRLGAGAPEREYREVGVILGALPVRTDLALGPETEPGSWETIGDTSPEQFGGTNSGSLLADGTVFFCHDTRDPVRFDPVSLQKTLSADSGNFQGCSGVSLLGTGELIFVGGQQSTDFTDATRIVKTFDTWTGQWAFQPSLNLERWYPALARLADGGLLACGGGQSPSAQRTETCERYDPLNRIWTLTSPMSQPSEYSPTALLHTGEILKTWFPPELYDPAAETWRSTAGTVQQAVRPYPDHCDHSLIVLRDGQAVIAGVWGSSAAGSPEVVMAEHYDPCTGQWRLGGDNSVGRARIEAAQLPDGKIVVAGGAVTEYRPAVFVNADGYTRLVDLYDPARETWREVAEMRIAREYHATTLLLPDGRVLTTAGGGNPAFPSPDMGIDAYSPPYLFRGPRPVVRALPTATLRRGEFLDLDVDRAPRVTAVILIGAQATTHYVDGAVPRRLALAFEQAGDRVRVRVPASATSAPEGWYILFVMVDDVPSEGTLVRLDAALSSPPPDSIGPALRATKDGPDVVLDWRRGPLNPSQYNVYRSAIASDLQLLPNRIGSRAPLGNANDESYRDVAAIGRPEKLYFYRVLGRACDGTGILP